MAKLDPSTYSWHTSPTQPTVSRRRALASEALWIHRPRSIRQLFLSGTLKFPKDIPPPTLSAFRAAAHRAWWRLRCENPILAARTRVDVDGRTWLECEALEDGWRRKEWVERTVVVKEGKWIGWEDLRKEFREGGGEFARLCLGVLGGQSVGFLLNVDHVITDGVGVKILAGMWFQLLASEIGSIAVGTGESKMELPPPWTDIMNEHQVTEGHEVECAVRRQREFLMSDCVCSLRSDLSASPHQMLLTHSDAFSRPRTSTASNFSRPRRQQTRKCCTKHTSALSRWKKADFSCNVSSLNSAAALQSHILVMPQLYLRCCGWKDVSLRL